MRLVPELIKFKQFVGENNQPLEMALWKIGSTYQIVFEDGGDGIEDYYDDGDEAIRAFDEWVAREEMKCDDVVIESTL